MKVSLEDLRREVRSELAKLNMIERIMSPQKPLKREKTITSFDTSHRRNTTNCSSFKVLSPELEV